MTYFYVTITGDFERFQYFIAKHIYSKTKILFSPLSASHTKCSNIFKQLVDNLPTNCLSVFDHFAKLALKGLRNTNPFFASTAIENATF